MTVNEIFDQGRRGGIQQINFFFKRAIYLIPKGKQTIYTIYSNVSLSQRPQHTHTLTHTFTKPMHHTRTNKLTHAPYTHIWILEMTFFNLHRRTLSG